MSRFNYAFTYYHDNRILLLKQMHLKVYNKSRVVSFYCQISRNENLAKPIITEYPNPTCGSYKSYRKTDGCSTAHNFRNLHKKQPVSTMITQNLFCSFLTCCINQATSMNTIIAVHAWIFGKSLLFGSQYIYQKPHHFVNRNNAILNYH